MQGISILIVDDDKLLVEKLEKTMRWQQLGISTVLSACNIRQARSLMEEYPVQILLCDIDMPQGSGLELLEWVRDRELDVECVFLSSYANFAYAQMALHLSSREYLLKPISNADLGRALAQVVEVVRKKRKIQSGAAPMPYERLWEDLLLRRVPEQHCIRSAIREGICGPEERFCLVLLGIAGGGVIDGAEKKDIGLFDFVTRNIAGEFFRNPSPGVEKLEAVVHISDLEWMLVLRMEEQQDSVSGPDGEAIRTVSGGNGNGENEGTTRTVSGGNGDRENGETIRTISDGNRENKGTSSGEMEERICGLIQHLRQGLGRRIGAYLGLPTAFSEIGGSRERLEYMEEHAVFDEDAVLCEDRWRSPASRRTFAPWEIWKRELQKTGDTKNIHRRILDYMEEQRQGGGWERESLEEFLREMVALLYQYLDDQKYEYAQLFDRKEFQKRERTARVSMAGAKEFADYIFGKLQGGGGAPASRRDVVEKLKEYIAQHLGEGITRAELARTVYLSEGYLSRIFLKETGISLPNYIAERRIEKAREYLEHSALPVSRIATEVGYNNFSYFSRTFRELTGCTPNEYRMRINKKEHRD